MKNKLTNLNDHLFAQLERLSDEDLTADQLETEISRADAIVEVSSQIVSNADLQFKAAKLVADHGAHVAQNLGMISNQPLVGKPKLIKAAGDE